MARRLTFAMHPRWLALHVAVAVACTAMVLLGRWQWHVGIDRHGAVQNYAYALQWWAFTLFTLAMWVRVLRDARHADEQPAAVAERAAAEPVAYRRYVMPQRPVEPADPERVAYNAYLQDLAEADRQRR